jgi:hypothetical protein
MKKKVAGAAASACPSFPHSVRKSADAAQNAAVKVYCG